MAWKMRIRVRLALLPKTMSLKFDVFRTEPGEQLKFAPDTEYWKSKLVFDPETQCYLSGDNKFCNASNYGLSGLPPNREDLSERKSRLPKDCGQETPLTDLQKQSLRLMKETAIPRENGIVWEYDYDTRANDILIYAPYPSAFSQAVNIHALLFGYCKTGEKSYQDLAKLAGNGMLIPFEKGGMRVGDFFAESPLPEGYLAYTLNGHMYSVAMLYALHESTGDKKFLKAAEEGTDWLEENYKLFDTGYWTRYDLRPRGAKIYIEFHFKTETKMKSVTVTSGNSVWTVCETGCDQSVGEVTNGNSWRIAANLPDLIEYDVGETIQVEVDHDGPAPMAYSGPPRFTRSEMWFTSDQSSFEVPISDTGWNTLSPFYMKWHSFLMNELGQLSGREEFFEISERWYQYLEDYNQETSEERLRYRTLIQ